MIHALFFISPVLVAFGLGFLLFRGLALRHLIRNDWRIHWAFSTVLVGLLFIIIAEIAGAFNAFSRPWIIGAWLAVDLLLAVAVGRLLQLKTKADWLALVNPAPHWRAMMQRHSRASLALWTGAVVWIGALGLLALHAPTTVWDCQTYHMPRVMQWIQQKNLAHFATNFPSQDDHAPAAEIQAATLALLDGSDYPVNLSQWWALLTCAILAGFLAEELWKFSTPGRSEVDPKTGALCGAFVGIMVLTLPNAAQQAITTQSDLLAALWIVLAVSFGFLLMQEPKNRFYLFGIAGALSLGVATKSTTFIFAAPWLAVLGLIFLWKRSPRPIIELTAALLIFTLPINAPWMVRNWKVFGRPLSAESTFETTTSRGIRPANVAANVLRNLSFYTRTESESVTGLCNKTLSGLYSITREPLYDANFVVEDYAFEFPKPSKISYGDGFGTCFLPMLILLSLALFPFQFKRRAFVSGYMAVIFLGFILLCALLKWQPWNARFHFPYLFFSIPVVGIVLVRAVQSFGPLAISIVLTGNALLAMLFNLSYPIIYPTFREISREKQYFAFPSMQGYYGIATDISRDIVGVGCTNVFLKSKKDSWEYPLWVCLREAGFKGTIHHVMVENQTAPLGATNWAAPRSVLVGMDEEISQAATAYPLLIRYGVWMVRYPAPAPEERTKLLDGCLTGSGFNAPGPSMAQIRARVVDDHGQPASNIPFQISVHSLSSRVRFPSNTFEITFPVQPGDFQIRIKRIRSQNSPIGGIAFSDLEFYTKHVNPGAIGFKQGDEPLF